MATNAKRGQKSGFVAHNGLRKRLTNRFGVRARVFGTETGREHVRVTAQLEKNEGEQPW